MNPSRWRGVRSLALSDNKDPFFCRYIGDEGGRTTSEGSVGRRRETSRWVARTGDVSGVCPRVQRTDNSKLAGFPETFARVTAFAQRCGLRARTRTGANACPISKLGVTGSSLVPPIPNPLETAGFLILKTGSTFSLAVPCEIRGRFAIGKAHNRDCPPAAGVRVLSSCVFGVSVGGSRDACRSSEPQERCWPLPVFGLAGRS
jgi:hypothetical protein